METLITNVLKRRIKNYIKSFETLEDEIDFTLSNIKPLEFNNEEIPIDYLFLGRSSASQRTLKYVSELIQIPIDELIEIHQLKVEKNFDNFMTNYVPFCPRDRDYAILSNTKIARQKKENIEEYLQSVIPILDEVPRAEFRIETLDYWKDTLKTFPYKRPWRNHIKDIPYSSILIYESENNHTEINQLLENIKLETGNPRTYKEFKIELKEFQKTIETSCWI